MKPVNLNKFKLRQGGTKIEYVEENGKRYAIRNGKRVEFRTLDQGPPPKPKREAFRPKFVMMPQPWFETLRGSSGGVFELALVILTEEFRHRRTGGEIKLSAERTRMSRTTRHRAAKELERLGLIKLSHEGNHVLKVILG